MHLCAYIHCGELRFLQKNTKVIGILIMKNEGGKKAMANLGMKEKRMKQNFQPPSISLFPS